MQSINIKNKIILLRSDLNDSIENNILKSTDRIDASLTSIFNLLNNDNKIVLISHLSDDKQTILPVANYIKKNFTEGEFVFLDTLDREEIYNFVKNNFHNNDNLKVIMLENLRSFPIGLEEKSDDNFSSWLASLAEYFVFDAFSVAHRNHASVTQVAKYLPHTLGEIANREYNNLNNLLNDKQDLFVILGGAKISTKLPLIKSLLNNHSTVFVGGAMANTLLYLKGFDVKDSLIEKDINIEKEVLNHKNLIILENLEKDYIWDNNKIIDLNKDKILEILNNKLKNYTDIFWNGPFGMFENGFDSGTNTIIEILNSTENKNKTIVGGGDTLTSINNWGNRQKEILQNQQGDSDAHNKIKFEVKYKSLSGGAALTFLEKGTLPGIEANR